jgi:hypothetical protein
MQILIVDDEAPVAEILAAACADAGHRRRAAAHARRLDRPPPPAAAGQLEDHLEPRAGRRLPFAKMSERRAERAPPG